MARDKFAAMASRNAAEKGVTSVPNPTVTVAPAPAPAADAAADGNHPLEASSAQPPRRDKLAAMASRNTAVPSSAGRGNKLAAMAASVPKAASDEMAHQEQNKAREQSIKHIKEKLSKRKKILENLDRAEDLTCKLLEIAHQTTKALEDLSCAPNISELSRAYRETIRELHPLLSTNTEDLVQPYQNHTRETKQSMYAARVEMRLAKERTQVLKIMTDLEKKQRLGSEDVLVGESKKRPRE